MNTSDTQDNKKDSAYTKNEITQESLLRHINFLNIKIVSIFFLTIIVIYHGYTNLFYNSCDRLLDPGRIASNYDWQPNGCMIHKYTKSDLETCFKYVKYYNHKNNFLFIGDFRVREMYHSFIHQLDSSYRPSDNYALNQNIFTNDSKNLSYTNQNLNLEVNFLWRPVIDEDLLNFFESFTESNVIKPSIIVMGVGISYIKMNSEFSVDWFKANLSNLVNTINEINLEYKNGLKQNLDNKNLKGTKKIQSTIIWTPCSTKKRIKTFFLLRFTGLYLILLINQNFLKMKTLKSQIRLEKSPMKKLQFSIKWRQEYYKNLQ